MVSTVRSIEILARPPFLSSISAWFVTKEPDKKNYSEPNGLLAWFIKIWVSDEALKFDDVVRFANLWDPQYQVVGTKAGWHHLKEKGKD